VIRPATDSESAKLRRKWVKSFVGHGARMTRMSGDRAIHTATFERAIRLTVDHLLATSIVACAVDPMRPARAIGYVAYTKRDDDTIALHYVFVEKSARRHGHARNLLRTVLAGREYACTFLTPDGSALIDSLEVRDANAA
jgi:predicted GNAT family acetyltransferase